MQYDNRALETDVTPAEPDRNVVKAVACPVLAHASVHETLMDTGHQQLTVELVDHQQTSSMPARWTWPGSLPTRIIVHSWRCADSGQVPSA